MSEMKTPIKTINGHALVDTEARAGVEANGNTICQLTEENEAIKKDVEELKENGIPSGGGVQIVERTGAFITETFDRSTEIKAVSVCTPPYGASGRYSNDAFLHHINGVNLFDFVDIFGGIGVTEYNGVTFEVQADSTLTMTGTGTANGAWGGVNLFQPTSKIIPAGTYAIGDGLTLAFNKLDSKATLITKQTGGTITIEEPAYITQASIEVRADKEYNSVVKLALVRGYNVPDEYLAYDGQMYYVRNVVLTQGERVIDWQTGTISSTDGEILATFDPVTITSSKGENSFFTTAGSSAIRYETIKQQSGAVPTIDHELWGLPVLKLYGDTSAMTKDVAVTLEYKHSKGNGTCEVKWQGSSSIGWPKKNYTIKFDNAFEAKEGWGEQKKYCFKANFIDHSHARNIVSCTLWGQIVKSRATPNETLNALPNGGAIDGFPCVIMLNNEFHGLYTWNIPKDGWMFGMGSGENEAIVCADGYSPGTTFTGDATLNGDFDLEYVSDEDNQDWLLPSLNRLINAVVASDGSDLDTTIAQYIDWDSAIDYYIYNVLEQGTDAMDKNYLLATYDGVKWFFSAYDRDTVYGISWDGKSFKKASSQVRFQNFADRNRVMQLIRDYKRDELKARYEELRAGVLSEDNVANVFSNFIAGIPSALYMADVEKWQTIPSSAVNNLSQIVNWYRLRVETIDAEMDALK